MAELAVREAGAGLCSAQNDEGFGVKSALGPLFSDNSKGSCTTSSARDVRMAEIVTARYHVIRNP
jgi:hypothetical protein